jgi:hypothetical protein
MPVPRQTGVNMGRQLHLGVRCLPILIHRVIRARGNIQQRKRGILEAAGWLSSVIMLTRHHHYDNVTEVCGSPTTEVRYFIFQNIGRCLRQPRQGRCPECVLSSHWHVRTANSVITRRSRTRRMTPTALNSRSSAATATVTPFIGRLAEAGRTRSGVLGSGEIKTDGGSKPV